MSNTSMPELIVGGGTPGEAAGNASPTSLAVMYENLISGAAAIETSTGAKVLTMQSAMITDASPIGVDVGLTSAEVAQNFAILQEIAAWCKANDVTVEVDAEVTFNAVWPDGHNALVDQWAPTAAAAGLPISAIENVDEPPMVEPSSDFAATASIEANAVQTLIEDYANSSYQLTVANLQVGDMEPDPSNLTQWLAALNAAEKAIGMPEVSFITPDWGEQGPWINSLSNPSLDSGLVQESTLSAQMGIGTNALLQGVKTDLTGDEYIRQIEQNAAEIATLQGKGSISVASLMLQIWSSQPVGVDMVTAPDSSANAAAEITATYTLYATGSITAQGPISLSAPGQVVMTAGGAPVHIAITSHWDKADVANNAMAAIVLIDQTGALSATRSGNGGVSNNASNILILTGDEAELNAELSSVTVSESSAGADTLDIEAFGAQGQLVDDQVSMFAVAPGGQTSVASSNSAQGWLASSALLNTGTIVSGSSIMTSETLTWSMTGTAAGGQTAFQKFVTVHEPLAEYGVEEVPASTYGTPGSIVVGQYNSAIDNLTVGEGYANNPGANNIVSPQTTGWISPFYAPGETAPLQVKTTVNIFDPNSGELQTQIDALAPDPITVSDDSGVHADTFATAFNLGGTQVTEYDTGTNMDWQAGWGSQFNTATLTYDAAGTLVELVLQGGSANPWFTLDEVFNPNNGKLWEEFQETSPPPASANGATYLGTDDPYQSGFVSGPVYVTQFNTGDNPNWDYVDWGLTATADTEVWTDYFAVANYAGFAVNMTDATASDAENYPLQFADGAMLDLLYLPGSVSVNLNALGTVTLDGQTETVQAGGFAGLTGIDAWGATGLVLLTGLRAGGSTLIGGNGTTVINGYDNDQITAEAGETTINTGGGGSSVTLATASGTVSVLGDNNVINAATGGTLTISGTGDTVTAAAGASLSVMGTGHTLMASGVTVDVMTGSGLMLFGDNDVVSGSAGASITIVTGTGNTVSGSNATITVVGGALVDIAGTNDVVNFIGPASGIDVAQGNTVLVTDSAADVFANLGALATLVAEGVLRGVDLTGASASTVTFTEQSLTADAPILALIHGNWSASVTAASAADAADIAALPYVGSVAVVDSPADVAANLSALEALAASGKLAGIQFTGSPNLILSISDASLIADQASLRLVQTPYILDPSVADAALAASLPNVSQVVVIDTAANITAGLGTLDILAAAGKISSIQISDGAPLTLSVAQVSTDVAVLPVLEQAVEPSGIDISDSISAIDADQTQLTHLAAAGVISTVSVSGDPDFTITCLGTLLPSALQTIDAEMAAALPGSYYMQTISGLALIDTDIDGQTLWTYTNTPIIRLGGGFNMIELTSSGQTVYGGSGWNGYCISDASAGDTIVGGSGSNNLFIAMEGASFTMGANVTGIDSVWLGGVPDGFSFTASATSGLTIRTSNNSATVTVGAASQAVLGGEAAVHVIATAANAGALVQGGSGGATLEIASGGNAVLNGGDSNLFVSLDAATNLRLGGAAFITAEGAISAGSTIVAGGANQTLTSRSGANTLAGYAGFGDTFSGTTSGLSGDVIMNFGGNDIIDVTDLTFAALHPLSFATSSGALEATDGVRAVSLTLSGGLSAANLVATDDGHGGTIIRLANE